MNQFEGTELMSVVLRKVSDRGDVFLSLPMEGEGEPLKCSYSSKY